jgi:hypothetical protein
MIELLIKMLLSFQQFEPKRLQSRNNRLDFEGEVLPKNLKATQQKDKR